MQVIAPDESEPLAPIVLPSNPYSTKFNSKVSTSARRSLFFFKSEGMDVIDFPPLVTEKDYSAVDEGDFYLHIAKTGTTQIWYRMSGCWVSVKKGDRFQLENGIWRACASDGQQSAGKKYDIVTKQSGSTIDLALSENAQRKKGKGWTK